jgi:putative copper export protein
MIIEYLNPDPNLWDGITVVVRAAYYAASLGAAGLALFLVAYGGRMGGADEAALRRMVGVVAVLAILLSLGAAVVRVQLLTAGQIGDLPVWQAMFRSRIGDAFYLRMAGLVLILVALRRTALSGVLAGIGAILVVGSYAAMGHSMLYRPRQELAVLVTVHLLCIAWWVGSLWPLARVARTGGKANLAQIQHWSASASWIVALLIATGATAAVLLIQQPGELVRSWYGNGFIVKMVLVAGALALAARHKLVLTRRIEKGDTEAERQLSRSISLEIIVMLLIFYAAAEMVSVHPTDLGHRIPA